jgi:microcystin-dependent protein
MAEPYIGSLLLFAGNFAIRGYAVCNGQLLAISQNTALFSILGTTYGGNGQTTFGLPDLRGRAPIHQGSGPGLPNYVLGEVGGSPSVTLISSQMPQHSHGVAAASSATTKNPNNAVPAFTAAGSSYGTNADLAMAPGMLGIAGGSQPHENMPPYLALNWLIAVEGIFPSRN